MKYFRLIFVLLALSVTTACHAGYYVYGDSQTSQPHSWANKINEIRVAQPDAGVPYMQVNAVPAITLTSFLLPKWIKPTPDVEAIILFMGLNDVGSGVALKPFTESMNKIYSTAQSQELPLICIEIPEWGDLNVQDHRTIMKYRCDHIISVPLQLLDSPDTLHMGPEGHAMFALIVLHELNLLTGD